MAIVEFGEFKGNKMIILKRNAEDKYPFQFGLSKARLILEAIERGDVADASEKQILNLGLASLPTLEPGRKPRLVPVDGTGFRLAVEGLCHENAGKADQGVMGLWASLVDRMVWRILESEMGEPRLDQLWLAVREDVGGTWNLRRMARCIGMSQVTADGSPVTGLS